MKATGGIHIVKVVRESTFPSEHPPKRNNAAQLLTSVVRLKNSGAIPLLGLQ